MPLRRHGWRAGAHRTPARLAAGDATGRVLMRHPPLHWLLLIALVAMWGSSFLLTKVAVTSLPPPVVVAGRISIAAVLLVVLVLFTRRRLPARGPAWMHFLLLALIGNVLPFLLISWGQQRIDSGLAGILMAVMPLTTLVLAHFFVDGERLTGARLAGFAIGFAGIVVLVGPQALAQLGGSGEALVAQLAVLGGATCYAVHTILARRHAGTDVWMMSAVVLALAAALTVPLAAVQAPWPSPPPEALLAVAVLGLVCTAVATATYFKLVGAAGPTFVSLINYLIPLWAVVLGMAFLGERPDWSAVAALGLILAGIALSQRG